jgi:hypothetical protein
MLNALGDSISVAAVRPPRSSLSARPSLGWQARELAAAGREVYTVVPATRFAPAAERAYALDPRSTAG